MLDITCIEFSEGIKRRSMALTKGQEYSLLLSEAVQLVILTIVQSGDFLQKAKNVASDSFKPPELILLDVEQSIRLEHRVQSTLAAAGITDDTTASQWLTPIEEKLKIARSEYQKISDRQAAEMTEFCNQWMVK